jgi:very-short-patch-repair endonuclease
MDARNAQGWPAVAALAATQNGRVHVTQLRGLGISRGSIEKAVRSGRLHREHVGVYAVGHVAPTRTGRWHSAVLACGSGALLSHRSAASLWGIRDGEGPRVDVTVPTRNGRRRPGITVHRAPLTVQDAAVRFGVPVTSVARTIADMAFTVDEDAVIRTVREAQFHGLFDLAAVERTHARAALGRILEDLRPTDSALGDEFLALLDRHGLPRPVGQQNIMGHRVDFVWPGARLVVEVDGAGAHLTFDAFQRDRSQANVLQRAGYVVLRFTAADIRRRPARVAALVDVALGRFIHPLDA